MKIVPWIISLAAAGTAAFAAPIATVAELRQGHRLLIVSAPAGDHRLADQRTKLAAWKQQGQERDVVTIVLNGSSVVGASDAARAIRALYAVPAGRFALTLVGKDGHVAWRAAKPASGDALEQVIDAMPMRRAGQR